MQEGGSFATLLLRRVTSLGVGLVFFLLLLMAGNGSIPPGVLDNLEINSAAGERGCHDWLRSIMGVSRLGSARRGAPRDAGILLFLE